MAGSISEAPQPTEGPRQPIETFRYTLPASEYFRYLIEVRIPDSKISNRKDPTINTFENKPDLLSRAGSLLRGCTLEDYEGQWNENVEEHSQDPLYQEAFLHMFSWRIMTLRDDLLRKRTEGITEETAKAEIIQNIQKMEWEDLLEINWNEELSTEDSSFDILSYMLVQSRREELIHGLMGELMLPDYVQAGFDIEGLFNQRVFATPEDITEFLTKLMPPLINESNIEIVRKNLFVSDSPQAAITALQLFAYLKAATSLSPIEDTSLAIARQIVNEYKEGVSMEGAMEYPPVKELVERILPRVGIPTHEIFYRSEWLTVEDLTEELAVYIGKFASDMNITHLNR